MVLGVPRTPLQIIYCSGKCHLFYCNIFVYCLLYCLLPIVLPIAYCIAYCLLPIVLPTAYWIAYCLLWHCAIPPLCHSAIVPFRR